MRNYELMRKILVKTHNKGENLELLEILSFSESDDKEKISELEEELARLKDEGLIFHDMSWSHNKFNGGTVQKLTPAGEEFAREIHDIKVWSVCKETLDNAKLDISYPLIKKVCERIIENIVMKSIPKEFRD